MSCQAPLLVAIMVFALFALYMLGFYFFRPISCASEPLCPSGRLCPAHWLCCEEGCCAPPTDTIRRVTDEPLKESHYDYSWYAQWSVMCVLASLVGVFVCCVCCVCRRSSHGVMISLVWRMRRRPTSEHDSAGSIYPPPRYSRCGSFHNAPPRYSEVTSKPDLYPLVITCGEGDGKSGGNYLLVHYFRNYVRRAPGSLSAASTAESLNSSFICNAANEANSIIPPPYSRTQTYDEFARGRSLRSLCSLSEREPRTRLEHGPGHESTVFRDNLITSPVQPLDSTYDLELELMDCEMYCDGECKPRLGSSPPVHRSTSNVEDNYEHEPYRLRHMFSCPSSDGPGVCESPPQPTSPTQTSRDSTLRRTSDERWQRRLDTAKKTKLRKSSLYMPLSVAYPVRQTRVSPNARASSRSAPATPCSSLVPNILTFTQRVTASRHSSRSSRCQEESNPLLTELEQRTDHKF